MTRTALRTALLATGLLAAGLASAAPHGNVVAGQKKAAPCAACHGDGNKTLDATYPKLAGQYPDYLVKALSEYRSGKRQNAIMAGQAKALSDQDIADLAAWFGSRPGGIHDLSRHQR
jgi:cytochrome c553